MTNPPSGQESYPLTEGQGQRTDFPLDGTPVAAPDGFPAQTVPGQTVHADPLPAVDPTGHIYAASSGVALANTANQALHRIDENLRVATIAAARGDDGKLMLAVYGDTRAHTEQAVAQLRGKGYNVLDAPVIRTPANHAERQLYAAGYTEIGISRQAGMCDECEAFFRDKPHVRITPYKPQH